VNRAPRFLDRIEPPADPEAGYPAVLLLPFGADVSDFCCGRASARDEDALADGFGDTKSLTLPSVFIPRKRLATSVALEAWLWE
jgi:hypothetical protein